MELIYPEESYTLIGACFEVYKEMGCGFLEQVYQECLEIELARIGVPFQVQNALTLKYKGQQLKSIYKPDFICWDKIIIEVKSINHLADEHRAQVFKMRLGLLINFNHYPKIEYERIVL